MLFEQTMMTYQQAELGLYMTPDVRFCATSMFPIEFAPIVAAIHERQPQTGDMLNIAERAQEYLTCWHARKPKIKAVERTNGEERDGGAVDIDMWLFIASIRDTHFLMERAIRLATMLAIAVHQRTINVADDWPYPRIIPDSLEQMSIPSLDAVSDDDMHRILCAEPFVGFMEMLRSQQLRMIRLLRKVGGFNSLIPTMRKYAPIYRSDPDMTALSKYVWRGHKDAKRSIRRSTDMYARLGQTGLLKKFLRSEMTPLILSGHRYDFHLRIHPDLVEGSTMEKAQSRCATVSTSLHKKGTLERIADMCVYFHDTPPLDFVLAMWFHLQNEQKELDILHAGCFSEPSMAFYNDPLLTELKGIDRPHDMPQMASGIINHCNSDPDAARWEQSSAAIENITPKTWAAFRRITGFSEQHIRLLKSAGEFEAPDFFEELPGALQIGREIELDLHLGGF